MSRRPDAARRSPTRSRDPAENAGRCRPLYEAAAGQSIHREPDGHAGLWFDKFCDRWRIKDGDAGSWTLSGGKDAGDSPKLEWIKQLTRDPIGMRDQIEAYALRLVRLVGRCGGRIGVFTTESGFVTGLGRSHPVENGFAWHPTLGTPYLPGSSVKGLVRAWAREQADPRSDPETLTRVFGESDRAGEVRFLDAVPTNPVKLDADVMTPHYGSWSEDDPPGDWRSPNPIPFLTTASGASFLFGFIPDRPATSGDREKDLDAVSEWLCDALQWTGGGAKTAVGYGRFGKDDEQTRHWTERLRTEDRHRREERERREAMESPEGRWRLELERLSETRILEQVRVHLEMSPLEPPHERRAFAMAVPGELVGLWRRGRKQEPQTVVGKKKLRERARLIERVLAETGERVKTE